MFHAYKKYHHGCGNSTDCNVVQNFSPYTCARESLYLCSRVHYTCARESLRLKELLQSFSKQTFCQGRFFDARDINESQHALRFWLSAAASLCRLPPSARHRWEVMLIVINFSFVFVALIVLWYIMITKWSRIFWWNNAKSTVFTI